MTEKGEKKSTMSTENEEKLRMSAKLIVTIDYEMKIEFDSNKKSIKCQRKRVELKRLFDVVKRSFRVTIR
jgi:hypothetical protein